MEASSRITSEELTGGVSPPLPAWRFSHCSVLDPPSLVRLRLGCMWFAATGAREAI